MNGQMKKYMESLSRTPGPIMPSQIPKVKLDMKGMVKYAKFLYNQCEVIFYEIRR